LGYSLRDIAEELGAHVHGDENCRIDRVATLADAEPGGISFLANRRFRPQLLSTRASDGNILMRQLDEVAKRLRDLETNLDEG